MKIEIELPEELHKALKIDFASQVIAEKFLGQELSASTKVVDLVLKAAQQSLHPTVLCTCFKNHNGTIERPAKNCLVHNPHSG